MSKHHQQDESEGNTVPAQTGGSRLFGNHIWEPLARMREEMDHLYSDFTHRPFGAQMTRRLQALSGPALELKDKDSEYQLIAEIPGLKAEDIEIKISEGVLRLSGERNEAQEGEKNGLLFSERSYGRFERAVQLPPGLDETNISAKAKDGILTIRLPKTEDARQRERLISVQSA
ncbi:MAG: Hsp20/alpha crystallin family protein [Parasphingorhabdus sp.]|nr:Hsp20/alpha crystallin family protein [Parasphingorhabdus sp.]